MLLWFCKHTHLQTCQVWIIRMSEKYENPQKIFGLQGGSGCMLPQKILKNRHPSLAKIASRSIVTAAAAHILRSEQKVIRKHQSVEVVKVKAQKRKAYPNKYACVQTRFNFCSFYFIIFLPCRFPVQLFFIFLKCVRIFLWCVWAWERVKLCVSHAECVRLGRSAFMIPVFDTKHYE